jgi:hypothetical protein
LSPETARNQAESYLAYEGKHDFIERRLTFRVWCQSKDFSRDERRTIVTALAEMGVRIAA